MQPLTNLKQLRSFLGLVTFYGDMWPHHSHTLAPLTNILESKTFFWNPPQQQAFEKMKAIVARDALLIYPDNALPLDVETDASEYQWGSVIKQNGRPIAYYPLHTDHKNLMHQMTKFTTQRVLRWRLLLDEFGATFHYKTGSTNFIADALSRVPISFPDGKNLTPSDMLHACILADGLLVHPGFDEAHRHPFQFETIAFYQNRDRWLQGVVNSRGDYHRQSYGSMTLITYNKEADHKNLMHQMTKFTTQRVLRWRLLLDEFGATLHYKKESTNFIADALSRVPISFPDGKNLTLSDMLHICILADGLLVNPGFDEAHMHPFHFERIAFDRQTCCTHAFWPMAFW
ncbi:hypothetical protein IV203_032715 [Nitzschia inconspicua]|uniref:Reverse transcriptase/retrotransposon-derived protein RNase H-like domain-containing protein n=1 Tax=Nitzschia inconspicua TaxID=303405 RepID=A0A9K3KK36_9STRA|nr:hypothetical protein IV203_032715 [Nitzschia inconspicua]